MRDWLQRAVSRWCGLPRSLSARLLMLTILVVLVGEVFIYTFSIARFCEAYLLKRIVAPHLEM